MDKHIRQILKRYVSDTNIRDGYYRQKVESFWMREMGKTIANRTSSILLKEGILKISITSAPLRHDLMNSRQIIKDKVNAFLGEELIREVIIT